MIEYTPPLGRLVEELKRLPGIGRKSAQRIAFFLLRHPGEMSDALAAAIVEARRSIVSCPVCSNLSSQVPCEVCRDPSRESDKICVVEEPFHIQAIERTAQYRGQYHVLGGRLSPIGGIGPDELAIAPLLARIEAGAFQEVILATSPTTEGMATSHYLTEVLNRYTIKITRIALGLPVGADLDYADQVTVAKALEGRTEVR